MAASLGISSQIFNSGVREAIGRNGPRIVLGASGLRSNVSSWLGPPNKNRKMTFLARAGRPAGSLRPPAPWAELNPSKPAPPACNTWRRVHPLQTRCGRPEMLSMARFPCPARRRRPQARPGPLDSAVSANASGQHFANHLAIDQRQRAARACRGRSCGDRCPAGDTSWPADPWG